VKFVQYKLRSLRYHSISFHQDSPHYNDFRILNAVDSSFYLNYRPVVLLNVLSSLLELFLDKSPVKLVLKILKKEQPSNNSHGSLTIATRPLYTSPECPLDWTIPRRRRI